MAARTIAANSGDADNPLPPITCRMNTSRIATRALSGANTPMEGNTFAAADTANPPAANTAHTCSRTAAFPATTTGTRGPPAANIRALCSNTCAFPPSVPPTNSTTSGAAAPNAASPDSSNGPAETCSTRAPADNPTRYPASAVITRSYPTTANRNPPPALEHASTRDRSAPGNTPRNPASAARNPSNTSAAPTCGNVVGCEATATSSAATSSTTATLVNVDPKSTQTTNARPW